jgi:hypothetical protein
MQEQSRELDRGSAANAVLVSLLRTLVEKKLLTNVDARALLTRAASDLGHEYTIPLKGAAGVILNDLLPNFPEDGGD